MQRVLYSLILATPLLLPGCRLSSVSRETQDGAPSGLNVDDGGEPDAASADGPDSVADLSSGSDGALVPLPDSATAPDLTPPPPPAMLTQHNDNARTGANLRETVLNTSNVNSAQFGKLFQRDVDGYLYAQPLIVPGLTVGGAQRNVLYLATEHNSVFAFDADDPAAAAPLWQVNLGPTVPSSDYTCTDLIPEIGVTSTPVIDPASSTIYVSAKNKDADGSYHYRLHALDLISGAEKPGSPVEVTATVPGTGAGSDGTMVTFQPKIQLQRPALLLSHGQVYLSFGSHCDKGDYHGWVMAYDAATLAQTSVYNVTPNGGQGSLWMSGQGPAADADGNLIFVTGNGDTSPTDGAALSESVIKLGPALDLLDWFTPYNYQWMNDFDYDLGSAGALLVPGSKLVVTGGKDGVLYVADRTNLGHFHAGSNSNILQSFKIASMNIHGTPVYWQGPSDAFIYVWAEEDHLKAFRVLGGGASATTSATASIEETPAAMSPMAAPAGMPGGFLSISADGARAGSGILWVAHPFTGNANNSTVPGIVRAFDAADVSRELWDSEQISARDTVGDFAKFNSPTVLNGKLYLATFSQHLNVYGLLP